MSRSPPPQPKFSTTSPGPTGFKRNSTGISSCLRRRFRQTLFVKKEVKVETPARIAEVAAFHISAHPLTPELPEPDYSPRVPIAFDTEKGSRVTVDHPLAKAALYELADVPNRPIPVTDLIAAAARRIDTDPADVSEGSRNAVLAMLFQSFQVGMVHLAVDPPHFARHAGPKPRLWSLARHKLEAGSEAVPTLRHGIVRLETAITRQLLLACDGIRDHAAILEYISDWAASQPAAENRPIQTREELRTALAGELEAGLQKAADLALLVE